MRFVSVDWRYPVLSSLKNGEKKNFAIGLTVMAHQMKKLAGKK